jgi:hypothetical protein
LGYIIAATSTCLVNLLILVAVHLGLLSMHSVVTIAVIIALTVSRSVRCQPRADNIVIFDITGYHTLEDLLGKKRTRIFLNDLCQQTPHDGIVQGAVSYGQEPRRALVKVWADYMGSVGRYTKEERNWAGGRRGRTWDTFKVKCGLVASNTYVTNAPTQDSPWVQNKAGLDLEYEVPIEVTVEGFRCDSTILFWSNLLETRDPVDIPGLFLEQLQSELPDEIKNTWVGATLYPTSETGRYDPQVTIQDGHQLRLSTVMVERTVEAYLAIEVVEYFFGAGNRISAETWRGNEGWDRIYTWQSGTQCTGLCNLEPDICLRLQPFEEPLPPAPLPPT